MRISILSGAADESDRIVYDLSREVVRIGRSRSSDVRLPDPKVSLDHAHIVRSGGEFFVVDLGSTNGTRLGRRTVAPHQRFALRTGDVLHCGPFSLLFEASDAAGGIETTSEQTASFARRILHEIGGHGADVDGPYLLVADGPGSGTRLRLHLREASAPYLVGRAEECDLVLRDPDSSRVHAEIVRDFSGVRAKDLGSKNGLILNGRPMLNEHGLAHGDEIRIGATTLRFVDPVEERLRALEEPADADLPPPWRAERAALVLAVSALAGCVAIWIWLLAF